MSETMLLESYLKELRLPMFMKHWRSFAQDAVASNHSYERFLLALAEQEVTQREQNRKERRIKSARFPVLKELSDFDFSAIPELSKSQVLQLAKGDYTISILLLCINCYTTRHYENTHAHYQRIA